MKLWMRKTLVVLFTIVTFGLVSPPAALMADKPSGQPSSLEQNDYTAFYDEHDLYDDFESEDRRDPELLFQSYKEQLLDSAEDQSFLKFGSKIAPVIEDDYRKEILPKIENVISDYLAALQDDEAYQDVVISSKPSAGKTEKIFNVYNRTTGEDLLRFHVRRDHPPHDGYWFNFHYHTAEDGFQSHHELGSIYWDRNTPPNWMSA
ncbi:YpjP family protein [Bacillus sp. FSL H8-0515]|uniref:YpjP family protein n=1 Tax=Bacillus sp. FSL H8-0515 TaxID=2921396 RepID=UPI00227DC4E8|nr:YpjP family protein [Bacillus sp. S20C3]MCY8289076.1 YpjP family protein [Bacillus sp. N13C7]MCY8638946.1 YpjP family protein [Bacillus sp. S17B2]MCY8718979.1 YpjP family protein [Bacillus sp. S10C12M]MCY9143937.1 YpjP family protein [Bacillus sp. T9C1]